MSETFPALYGKALIINAFEIKNFCPFAWHMGNYDYHNFLNRIDLFGEPCVKGLQEIMKAWDHYRDLWEKGQKDYVLTKKFSNGGRSFDPKYFLDNIWGLYTGKIKEVPLYVKAKSVVRAM